MERIAVIVPGMMGSSLAYPNGSGSVTQIWGSSLYENYIRLIKNSTLLRWDRNNPNPAQASLIDIMHAGKWFPFPRRKLWTGTLEYFSAHDEFGKAGRTLSFGYDWRQSLLDTATALGARLKEYLAEIAGSEQKSVADYQFVFVTHSMGGLVVRIALAQGNLDPASIDRIIHIGSPLEGSADAFGSAYSGPSLPMLRELAPLISWKNAHLFFDLLRSNIRTFNSIYQLMPPLKYDYLYYTQYHRKNPLNENIIPMAFRRDAQDAHNLINYSDQVIRNSQIKTFTIFTETHGNKKTDLEYQVRQVGAPNHEYEILSVHDDTNEGDGTVGKYSARGNPSICSDKPILNVTHAFMCNSGTVVQLYPTIL